MHDFAVRLEADDTPVLEVSCRDLPELNSYGDNVAHPLAEAVDAIEPTLSLNVNQRRAIENRISSNLLNRVTPIILT